MLGNNYQQSALALPPAQAELATTATYLNTNTRASSIGWALFSFWKW